MRVLNTPREIPERPTFFHVDLEKRGRHHLRIPPPTVSGALLALVQGAQDLAANVGDDPLVAIGRLKDVFAMQGAIVAAFWWHPTLDLETPRSADPLEYGQRVYEELYEAGYSMADIAVLWTECLRKLTMGFVEMQTVLDTMGFSGRRQAGNASPPSASVSDTLATHGASGA